MKDKFDDVTGEILPRLSLVPCVDSPDAAPAAAASPQGVTRKPKRLPRQSVYNPPEGAKPRVPAGCKPPKDEQAASFMGWANGWMVPVSFVAKDWGVSSRRIRALLTEGRLQGRLLANGYWEVDYPYRYIIGRRGPPLKRTQKAERRQE